MIVSLRDDFEKLRLLSLKFFFLFIPKGFRNCQLFIVNCQLISCLSICCGKQNMQIHKTRDLNIIIPNPGAEYSENGKKKSLTFAPFRARITR